MHLIDWLIAIVPVIAILILAIYARKYVRGVVDYLAAGRVAGRYVISVGDLASSLSVITLVAMVEAQYQTGYALGFWNIIVAPVSIIMALTGYCVYRFRETRALSIGQFLEMRYSRSFRIFAAALRTVAEMVTNAIGPAVAANFFIYFLGLPHQVEIFGYPVRCFVIVVALVLCLAMLVIWPAGRISLLVTDCFQGLLSYPVFVVIVGYILCTFSWWDDISPVMLDRTAGESFLNPFDISELRDFNIVALVVSLTATILNRASWIGNDTTNSGRTPHEQKMAGILGSWRNGFAFVMCTLIAITIITVMSHHRFATQAREIRYELAAKVAGETAASPEEFRKLDIAMRQIPEQKHRIGIDKPLSQQNNLDTAYLQKAAVEFGRDGEGNYKFQKFRTLYNQMMMPMTLRKILPVGLMGIFALLMIMLLISTDDSRIFNASSTIVQDVILPLKKRAMTFKEHIFYLRMSSLAVALFFFFTAMFFVQLDYINMFITIMCAVWIGGAGPVMVFGLYSRFGTTAGAYASIFTGSGISIAGLLLQRNWAQYVYPQLTAWEIVPLLDKALRGISAPFAPYVIWEMNPVKFPINSYELLFIAMISGLVSYIVISLLTMREPYNLERLLHRGKYSDNAAEVEAAAAPVVKWHWDGKKILSAILGITPEYTRGDKVIAWSVFIYTIVYQVGVCFAAVLVWNACAPWSSQAWSAYFYITTIIISGVVALISTVWFLWGGIIDTWRLFADLEKRIDNPLDDGRVEGHISLADRTAVENAEKNR